LPHLQETYERFKGQGFEIISINVSDNAPTVRQAIRENGWTFRFALDDGRTSAAYGVESTPTNYLLDSKGRIVWRANGFDGDGHTLNAELAKLGFK
jgi:peroxiredoxin